MHMRSTFLLQAIYAILLLALVITTNMTTAIKRSVQRDIIKDINVDITLFNRDGIVQLLIDWKDDLPKDTSYNVIVTAQNATQCPEPPCSVYGVVKGLKELVVPTNPMPYVDLNECGYTLGCNYSVLVETSNAMIATNTTVHIPYCVLEVCSCKHALKFPRVIPAVSIPKNDTIEFGWSLPLPEGEKIPRMLHIKITEQTNPSLSWGGKPIPIFERDYPFANLKFVLAQGVLSGRIEINSQKLRPHAVLNLRSFIKDEHCSWPENLTKVLVPDFYRTETALIKEDADLTVALVIISTLFACAIVGFVVGCLWRRKKAALHSSMMHKDDLAQLAIVEMEDNINYVDKYVEEAQAKGVADIFEVPHSAIRLDEEVGEGAFGRVYRAMAVNLRRMRGTTVVAVKQLKKNHTADEVSEFISEIEMLKGVGTHHNIVCFLGCCTIRPPYLMIMEYVGRGDLLTYLRTVRYEGSKFKPKDANHVNSKPLNSSNKPAVKYIELKISTQSVDSEAEYERQPKPSFAETTYTTIDDEYNEPFEYILDNKELHNFALQIANGMRFLEEQEITHRDLAARNVLIDDRKTLKISDFGLSRHGIYINTKTRKLPLRWLSIEAIRDNVYSNKSDVWAYGVVLWEIGTLGASPYPTISNHELMPYLLSGKRLEKPEICTEQVYALMLQCWDEDVEKRPSFEELYTALSPRTAYVDINSLSDDYVFPPIKDKDNNIA